MLLLAACDKPAAEAAPATAEPQAAAQPPAAQPPAAQPEATPAPPTELAQTATTNEAPTAQKQPAKAAAEPAPVPAAKPTQPSASKAKSNDDREATLDSGKAIYDKHCKKCHGANGDADTAIGKKNDMDSFLEAGWKQRFTLAKVVKVVTNGEKGTKMKPFRDKLSAEEIAAVATYARSLAKG